MALHQDPKYALAVAYFARYRSEYSSPIIFQQHCFSASRLLALLGFHDQAVELAKLAGADKLAQENLALIMTTKLRERPQVADRYRKRQAAAIVTLASQKQTTFSENRLRQAYIDVTRLLLDAGFHAVACELAARATPHALTAENLVGIARQLRRRPDISREIMITLMDGIFRFANEGLSEVVANQWNDCAEFMFRKGYFEPLRTAIVAIMEKLIPVDPLHLRAAQFLKRLDQRGQLDWIMPKSCTVDANSREQRARRPARRFDAASRSVLTAAPMPQPSGTD